MADEESIDLDNFFQDYGWEREEGKPSRLEFRVQKYRDRSVVLKIVSHPYKDFTLNGKEIKRIRIYRKDFEKLFERNIDSGMEIYFCSADSFEDHMADLKDEGRRVRMRNLRDLGKTKND